MDIADDAADKDLEEAIQQRKKTADKKATVVAQRRTSNRDAAENVEMGIDEEFIEDTKEKGKGWD